MRSANVILQYYRAHVDNIADAALAMKRRQLRNAAESGGVRRRGDVKRRKAVYQRRIFARIVCPYTITVQLYVHVLVLYSMCVYTQYTIRNLVCIYSYVGYDIARNWPRVGLLSCSDLRLNSISTKFDSSVI